MQNPDINHLDKSKAVLLKGGESTAESFVEAPPEVLFDFVWQLSAELYSFRGDDAERRLQRNVANLIRK